MEDADIAAALLAEKSVLDKDDIPNANQSAKCFSCDKVMTSVYCAECGQKNDDYRRSIFRLVGELVGSFTALESRMWRTWGALLFMPGRVAREYSDGARVKWSTPIRVFLAVSIILFGFLGLTKTQLISMDFNVLLKSGITKPHSELTNEDLKISGAIRYFQTQSQIDEQNKTRNFDLIEKWLNGSGGFNFDTDNGIVNYGAGPGKQTGTAPDANKNDTEPSSEEQIRIKRRARLDYLNAIPSAEITPEQNQELLRLSAQNVSGRFDVETKDWMTRTFVEVVRNPSLANRIIYKWLPRIMFLMMPITMFIGVIFIRGRGNALLYDHLVHAAYIHSVAFFLLFLGVILMRVFPGIYVAKTLFIIMLIYLPISLKRMFSRGWLKTIWASYGVGFLYFLAVTIIMTAAISYQIYKLAERFG